MWGDEEKPQSPRHGGDSGFKKSNSSGTFQKAAGFGGQLPPQSLEAEKALLGGLLLDPSAYSKISEIGLIKDDFYREANSLLFESIFELISRNEPVDLVTLSSVLKNKGIFELVGGTNALTALFDETFSSAHIAHYAKIIKEKAVLRKLISNSVEIIEKSYTGVDDLDDFLDHVESSIFDVTGAQMKSSIVSIRHILAENMQRIQELAEKNTLVTGMATGFSAFDRMTSGLQPGQLIIIAGRPAMGKTSLALNMAENAAVKTKASVAVFSLEMAKEELGFRFLTSLARVDASDLKVGRLKDRDWKALAKAAQVLSESKIFIDDTPAISILDLRSRCRRVQAEHGLNMILVDYLQLMRGSSKGGRGGGADSREREISDISRGLKALAKELRVPVIALSQLNRSLESRTDKRPMLSDLRESGAIEQDADIVAFVYRDEVYNKDSEDKGKAEFIIAKHRAGSVGTVRLNWDAQFTAFYDEDGAADGGGGHNISFQNDMPGPASGSVPPPQRKQGLDLPNF